ncbi:AI-2E family transporter [Parachryseolinea silvisoli]|uniref:AI-2E family transporter n=1 Tax=Parachryseolinea silvisoli TaxID=2873601 RepID=UPI002265BA01|nr:AI-2E family transporter [Parachryseolinea silvisoli]MCD9018946.1 AI-2E family transporter [Parachryseolinea silvisoli]
MKEIISRINQYLLLAILTTIVLFYGKVVLVPVLFAALLAMLMAPVCRWLDSKGLSRPLSTAVCILILLVSLLAVLGVVAAEISTFVGESEAIEKKANELLANLQGFIEETFGVAPEKQMTVVKEQVKNMGKSAGSFAGAFIGGITGTIAGLLITLVFTFLFLFNKERYESFFLKLYKDEEPAKVKTIVNKITTVAQKYLTGRVMSILTLATLYSIGLLIVGIKNAILLAGIAALLTVVPYVGSVLGGLFPFMIALVTEDSVQPALMVVVVIVAIQTIDNYFIEPNMVGGEVNLSAFASILAILVGGLVWGVAGMVLFIPMVGIIKIVCDHVEPLKPVGYVLGDPDGNKPSKVKEWVREKLHLTKKKRG